MKHGTAKEDSDSNPENSDLQPPTIPNEEESDAKTNMIKKDLSLIMEKKESVDF